MVKTMFVQAENISSQKKFKKPNILRKKSKMPIPKPSILHPSESLEIHQLLCNTPINETHNFKSEIASSENIPTPIIKDRDENTDTHRIFSHSIDNKNNMANNLAETVKELDMKTEEASNEELVNIEAFFNDSPGENVMLYDIDYEPGKPIETIMVIGNESPRNSMYIEQNPDLVTGMEPLTAVTSQYQEQNATIASTPEQDLYTLPTTLTKFKCDVPNCKKEFRSEQNLQKHKNNHNEDGSIKPSRQVTVECPVKKLEDDGSQQPCGRIFLLRELLLKHLNEEHTPDDASYRCEECGRRFFWASGLRAHSRAHCRRAASVMLACAWPGCGRVFRQPCRLREHARSHTGDRPYSCQYPECGWSFRSASKLVRHARRHTGERRHACGACGRAFLRREHLREHHARYHAAPRQPHACAHPGCELTFNNMSTLYLHMKKVHKNKENNISETVTTESLSPQPTDGKTFLVNFAEEPEVEQAEVEEREQEMRAGAAAAGAAGAAEGGSWRAARTHCTWPLRAAPTPAPLLHDHFTVEQSEENSESNIYTVRSDLFLHGNVLINEDSQQSGAVDNAGDTLENDLGLLDAHPTVDLMQEELLYTDVAADESSFRIFLLSGEELT